MADNPHLTGLWYFACFSADLTPGKMERRHYFGEAVVIGREENGTPFALRDVCPHRAAPLSAGRIVSEDGATAIACPYHGWRIRTGDGICSRIPALTSDSTFPVENMKTQHFPLLEEHGLIWIYASPDQRTEAPLTPPPQLNGVVGTKPKMNIIVKATGPYDEAVIGLIDPAHTPYVHQQWFWRNPNAAREKVKEYEPAPLGFRMKAHPPASNGRAYKIIGGAMTTEIEFRLPGIRIETIRNEKHTVLSITAITPTRDGESTITHFLFWDILAFSILKPILKYLGTTFLKQDGHILSQQSENIREYSPAMKYVEDPDELAKWYLTLKREWRNSVASGTNFTNPLSPATLRWQT